MTANDWAGMAVVCMASGPSLTPEDAEIVRQWRQSSDQHRVIVTNTTWTLAPWADALYAMDSAWWRKHGHEAQRQFRGDRLTIAKGLCPGATKIDIFRGGNSGAGAMSLANHRGARRIILLGYDCQYTGGKKHWHGDHPKGLGNCVSLLHFPRQFEQMAGHLKHCEIINSSRETALTFWPRMDLEQALCKFTALNLSKPATWSSTTSGALARPLKANP